MIAPTAQPANINRAPRARGRDLAALALGAIYTAVAIILPLSALASLL